MTTSPDQARPRRGMGSFEGRTPPWVGCGFPEARSTVRPKHTRSE